ALAPASRGGPRPAPASGRDRSWSAILSRRRTPWLHPPSGKDSVAAQNRHQQRFGSGANTVEEPVRRLLVSLRMEIAIDHRPVERMVEITAEHRRGNGELLFITMAPVHRSGGRSDPAKAPAGHFRQLLRPLDQSLFERGDLLGAGVITDL